MYHLHYLVYEASTITSSMTGVDYNDEDDHEDDYSMPSLLVFDPQEFVRPPCKKISIFGNYYKAKEGCG